MRPEVSIVIPTHRRHDLLAACLRSLDAQSFRDFETVVVDDGGGLDAAAIAGPRVRVLHLERNGGFARAVNRGIAASQGAWVMLLNDDMTLAPDALERLMAGACAGAGDMLAPLVLWRDTPAIVYSAGDRLRRNGRPEAIGFRAPRAGFAPPARVFGVSGGAGLFRREVFDRVGLLCEDFTAYFEDADLCLRARRAGFAAALVPEAVAWHVGSASIEGRTWWRARQCFINHALLVLRGFPLALLLRNAPAIARERLHQTRMLFSAARGEFGALRALGVLLGAQCALWRRVPRALAARRGIRRAGRIGAQALQAMLDEAG